MKKETLNFIIEHENDDTNKLLLSSTRNQNVEMLLAIRCIEARRKIKSKIPLWYKFPELEYPLPLSIEQGSSQDTALYKQRFIQNGYKTCDLTGGMGVDSYFLSLKASEHEYFERNSELFIATENNFKKLGTTNIKCYNQEVDSGTFSKEKHFDLIYLDPARRANSGSRIYSIAECEPNIVELKNYLFNHANKILVKVSPMADISHSISQIPEISEVHILACGNECKELLLLLDSTKTKQNEVSASAKVKICCTNINTNKEEENFEFNFGDENIALAQYLNEIGNDEHFIYDPNKAILKAGAFKLISEKYGIKKLATDTHIYASSEYIPNFPGRTFKILELIDFNKKNIKTFTSKYPRTSISAKNFPLSSDNLREKLKVKESDTIHTFGVSISKGEKILIVCEVVHK